MMQREIIDPLQDGKSRVQLINWMGSDLDVANDARASFEKTSYLLDEKDERLINYLLSSEPRHTSPLRGVVFKFKVKAPLFVARQWWKHTIASSHVDEQIGWNEKSYRYVQADESDYYLPSVFRAQSTSNKQASEGVVPDQQSAIAAYSHAFRRAVEAYSALLDLGVAREQARGVLPTCIYTSWVWTASLQAVLNFLDLRLGHGAQSEIVLYAQAIEQLIADKVPVTIAAYRG